MKVTVEQFLNAGFWFVGGDVVDAGCGNHEVFNGDVWNKPSHKDRSSFVVSLAPRPNPGTQPVADDCVVEIEYRNGVIRDISAASRSWDESGTTYSIKSWKPSLKHLDQQMSDKQKSAMNISERDIENAFIKQDDVDVERELSEGDSPIKIGKKYLLCWHIHKNEVATINFMGDRVFVYTKEDGIECAGLLSDVDFAEHLTPEQLAAKERESAIDQMWLDTIVGDYDEVRRDSKAWHHCSRIYDAGYRK